MNLAGVDLNLLVVFDALMAERHATRAGQRIGLSQPAVSKALNRLRYLFRDDLFIRSSDGMQPTARALELAAPIHDALRRLEDALDPSDFNPLTARRIFTITTNDLIASAVIPDVISYLDKAAPGIDIRLLPSIGQALESLDRQESDFAITPTPNIPDRFESAHVMNEAFMILLRKGHPLAEGDLTIERFVTARHILMSVRGDARSAVDRILEAQGLSRRVGITVNQFLAGPPIVARSDLLMLVPQSLARKQAPRYDLEIRPVPFELPSMFGEMRLIWSKRDSNNPASVWFRNVILSLTGHSRSE